MILIYHLSLWLIHDLYGGLEGFGVKDLKQSQGIHPPNSLPNNVSDQVLLFLTEKLGSSINLPNIVGHNPFLLKKEMTHLRTVVLNLFLPIFLFPFIKLPPLFPPEKGRDHHQHLFHTLIQIVPPLGLSLHLYQWKDQLPP